MKAYYIIAMTITALMLTGGITGTALADSKNIFNITVNCNSGQQVHKEQSSGATTNNVNISVNCSSTGGTPGAPGQPGRDGKNGENATITIVTVQEPPTSTILPPLVK